MYIYIHIYIDTYIHTYPMMKLSNLILLLLYAYTSPYINSQLVLTYDFLMFFISAPLPAATFNNINALLPDYEFKCIGKIDEFDELNS